MTANIAHTEPMGAYVADLVDGRYHLVAPSPNTGRGGLTIWCAHDERLNRTVLLEWHSVDRSAGHTDAGGLQEMLARREPTSPAVLDAGIHAHAEEHYFYVVCALVDPSPMNSPGTAGWGHTTYLPLELGRNKITDGAVRPRGRHRSADNFGARVRKPRIAFRAGVQSVGAAVCVAELA